MGRSLEPAPVGGGLSVVIPHWGDPALATRAAEAVLAQRWDRPLEVIVVDDASPTEMPTLAGAHVIRRAANGGFGSAVNTGAAVATLPWLLILNSDIVLSPGLLQAMVEAAESLPLGVVSPQLIGAGKPQPTASTFAAMAPSGVFARSRIAGRWRDRGRLDHLLGHDPDAVRGQRSRTEWVTGACLLLPTSLFRRVGGFDEAFHMFHEEIDLQRRLTDVGAEVWYLGDLEVEHEGGGSTDHARREAALHRSQFVYARRHGFAGRLLLASLAASALDAVYVAALRRAGRPSTPTSSLRSHWDAWRASASVLRQPHSAPEVARS